MCLSTGLLMSPTLAVFGCPQHPPLTASFLMLWTHCALHLSAGEMARPFRKPNLPCGPCGKRGWGRGGGENGLHPILSSPCPCAPERHCLGPGSYLPQPQLVPFLLDPSDRTEEANFLSISTVSLPIVPFPFC